MTADHKFVNRFGSQIALLAILLVSVFLQWSAVSRTVVDSPLRADAGQYFLSAYNLDNYGVYSSKNTWPAQKHPEAPIPDAVRPPGYPLFMLLVGRPMPDQGYVRKLVFVQAGLAVASVLLLFLIASRFLPPGYSHVAALLGALDPHLAVMSTYVLTETLFTFLLFASVYCLMRALQGDRRRWSILAGILLGLCGLTRPTLQLLPLMALLLAWVLPSWRIYRAPAAGVFFAFILVMSPSIIRDRTIPENAPQSNLQVNFLLHGSYPGFMYERRPESYGIPYRFDPQAAEAGSSVPKTLAYIGERVRQDPLAYLNWYLFGKAGFFLSWADAQGAGDILIYPVLHSPYFEEPGFIALRRIMHLLHWPLMLLGVAGILALWWRTERPSTDSTKLAAARLVALVVLYSVALHMIGAPFARYGIPFRPLLYPLALLAIQFGWARRWDHAAIGGPQSPQTEVPDSVTK